MPAQQPPKHKRQRQTDLYRRAQETLPVTTAAAAADRYVRQSAIPASGVATMERQHRRAENDAGR